MFQDKDNPGYRNRNSLIALMLAQRCEAEITAIEPDINSFEQACSNVGKVNGLKG